MQHLQERKLDYPDLVKLIRNNGALERIQTSDLCPRRAIQTVPSSLIGKIRLLMFNRSNIHGRDEVYHHTCLAAVEQF